MNNLHETTHQRKPTSSATSQTIENIDIHRRVENCENSAFRSHITAFSPACRPNFLRIRACHASCPSETDECRHPSIQASKHPSIQASKHPSISFHPEHPYARHGPMRASDPISLVPSYNRKPAQSHPRIPAGIRSPTQPTTTASQHAPPHPCWHPAFYAANSNRKSAACPSAPVYGLSIYVRMQRVRPSDRARPLRPAHIRANAPGRGRADGATTSQYTLEHPPSGGLAMGQTIQPAQVSPGEAMP